MAAVVTTPNDGTHTDVLGKVSGTFTYRGCNAGTSTWSTSASVTFEARDTNFQDGPPGRVP